MEGISDYVLVEAIKSQVAADVFSTMLLFILGLILLGILFSVSKTKKHRETFADLYIVGMIRKFAKEDGIDLQEELKELRRFEKIEKASLRSIDKQIEVELNEKISAKNQKKIDEINGVGENIEYRDLTK